MESYVFGKKLAELRKQDHAIKKKEIVIGKRFLKLSESYDDLYSRILRHEEVLRKLKHQLSVLGKENEHLKAKITEWEEGICFSEMALANIQNEISNENMRQHLERQIDSENMTKSFNMNEVTGTFLDVKDAPERIKGWTLCDNGSRRHQVSFDFVPKNYTLDEVRNMVWQESGNVPSDRSLEWERLFFSVYLNNPRLSVLANKSLGK